MGIIEIGNRLAKRAWHMPVVGRVLQLDYDRTFSYCPQGRFRGQYPSFAEAERAVPADQRVGYDHPELASLYRFRMTKACESDYAPLFWLRPLIHADARVFDFGGHVGVSYHGWHKYLSYPEGMRWLICDVPAITLAGEELARERPSPGLAFTNDIADAGDATVFLGLGSLQYVETSLPDLLKQSGQLPPHVILNKMPVHDGASFVTVQSTGRAFHAYRIYNRRELETSMTDLGYRIVDDWTNRETHCFIPFTDVNIEAYSGYYFARD